MAGESDTFSATTQARATDTASPGAPTLALLSSPNHITGSAVTGYVQMWAVDIHARTRSLVVNKRVIDSPLVGPGGWIVFSRYRYADGAAMGREEGTVVVGRLDPRPT
ncbi:MAG TPA: hypothetical protein VFF07_07250 [Actinomycetota bacterium]|nr:hypothetical protein [Actinomycetota bacterium]